MSIRRFFASHLGHQLRLTTIATGISAASSVVQSILLARHLGIAEFGVMAFVQSFAIVSWTLCNFNTFQPIITHAERIKNHNNPSALALLLRTCMRLDALMGVASMVLFVVLAAMLQHFHWLPESMVDNDIMLLCVLYSPITALLVISNTPTGYLRYRGRFGLISWIKIKFALTTTVCVGLAVVVNGDVRLCLLAVLVGRGGEFFYMYWLMRRMAPKVLESNVEYESVWQMLPTLKKALRTSYGQNFTISCMEHGDVFLAGWLLGDTQAGMLRVVRIIINALMLLLVPLRQLFLPYISRLVVAADAEGLRAMVRNYLRYAGVLSVVCCALVYGLHKPLLGLFITDATPLPDTAVMGVFMLAVVLNYLTVPIVPIFASNHWDSILFNLLTGLFAVYVALIVLSYNTLGLLAFALAYCCFYALLLMFGWYYLRTRRWVKENNA